MMESEVKNCRTAARFAKVVVLVLSNAPAALYSLTWIPEPLTAAVITVPVVEIQASSTPWNEVRFPTP